ncbi:hypothetical protein MSAN_01138200 [Mycena sanguinolenta]|uniref:Uncharacterized protein n=1 Tax=Mycena sanguinolenta TaxID=230812 RepID=A0A8H6YJN0_9AGAR|nr:hypothetical protein MSAN_01138200 [Mycena sanguinolenta]
MSGIRWLLAALHKLILKNALVQASTRGLLWLLAALWRATKKKSPLGSTFADDSRLVHPKTPNYEDENAVYPIVPTDTENPVVYISASSIPPSLQPYLNSGPGGSQSSEDITTHSMTQESHPLRNFSEHYPGTSSVPHLPPLTPAQDLQVGPGGSPPSANSSVVDHPLPGTDSPSHSRRSSGVHRDTTVEPLPCLSEAHPHIRPGAPKSGRRYKCTMTIPKGATLTTIILPPLTTFTPKNSPPEGWTTSQHPEGAQYFFHEEKRVFTDANLFDPATVVFINENIRTVNDFVRAHNVDLPPGVDLVLHESIFADESKGCLYYFVNHLNRCVFWIDNVGSELFLVTPEVRGMTSPSHCRHELEAQYWLHCAYYPRAFELTHEIVNELRSIVLHAAGDVLAFPHTPVSWKLHELRDMFAFIAHSDVAENIGKHTEKEFEGYSCFVSAYIQLTQLSNLELTGTPAGRLMHSFARYRFHGEPVARLIFSKQSVHETVQKQTVFIRLLNLLLFRVPHSHLSRMYAVTVSGLMNRRACEQLLQRLMCEWQESVINAAVVLAANVGFLSIQSVNQGSPAQVASYVSTLASIASISMGLLLLNYHRHRDSNSAVASLASIFNRTRRRRSLEALAVLHSLPIVMLMWSIGSFFFAFSFMCNESTNLASIFVIVLEIIFLSPILCLVVVWSSRDLVRGFKAKQWRRVVSWPITIVRKMYDSERSVLNV